jgi:hypothetical protein
MARVSTAVLELHRNGGETCPLRRWGASLRAPWPPDEPGGERAGLGVRWSG